MNKLMMVTLTIFLNIGMSYAEGAKDNLLNQPNVADKILAEFLQASKSDSELRRRQDKERLIFDKAKFDAQQVNIKTSNSSLATASKKSKEEADFSRGIRYQQGVSHLITPKFYGKIDGKSFAIIESDNNKSFKVIPHSRINHILVTSITENAVHYKIGNKRFSAPFSTTAYSNDNLR